MPLAIHLLLATAMAASATRGLLAQAAQVAPASPRASRTPQVGAKKAGAEAAAAAPHEVTAADLGDPSGTEAAAATDGLHTRGAVLALAVIPGFVIAQLITLCRVLAIGALVPVNEEVLTSVILDDETKTLLVIEELAGSTLGHD